MEKSWKLVGRRWGEREVHRLSGEMRQPKQSPEDERENREKKKKPPVVLYAWGHGDLLGLDVGTDSSLWILSSCNGRLLWASKC